MIISDSRSPSNNVEQARVLFFLLREIFIKSRNIDCRFPRIKWKMTVNKPAFEQLNKIESFNFGFGDRAFYGIVL